MTEAMVTGPTRPELAVGDELHGPTRRLTSERVQWYGDGMLSAATGELRRAQENIHTDADYARSQGLTTAIADGMHSTNWISSMLGRVFGEHYVLRGELRTKYIKPVLVDTVLRTRGLVQARTEITGGGVRYELAVWCESDDGTRLTDGDAVVLVSDGTQT